MSGPRFAGREVQLGGSTFVAAPLALGAVKRLASRIEVYAGATMVEQLDTAIMVLHASLQRNHPEFTVEQVEELVDMANVHTLFADVLAISGFTSQPKDGLEGNAPGPAAGTGQSSTPTSPPASAGPLSTSTSASP